jgi:hypothetical protein
MNDIILNFNGRQIMGQIVEKKKADPQLINWRQFIEIEKNKMVIMQIVPHAAVTNNNKRLWRALHQMLEMYERPAARTERQGFKFRYREKDILFYDVIFKREEGQKKIEFYISTSAYQAEKLKRKIENKMQVTIKTADIKALEIPKENTVIQEIRYLKHDIFSLNTNTNEAKTPIAAILNTIDELQFDGDIARLSICSEAESRGKWIKNAQWAHEKMKKGKVPQRAAISGKRAAAAAKIGIGGIVNEINEIITELFEALANSFFKSSKQIEKKKVIEKAYSLEDEINARKLSAATYEKLTAPIFKSRIRVAAHSQDKFTREIMGETLALAMNELSENNELQGVKINFKKRSQEIIEELNSLTLSKRTKLDGNVNLISCEEMAKLALQMPTKELQLRYKDALSTKTRVEAHIGAAMQEKSGIYLGESEVKDKSIPVYMPISNPDNFYRGYTYIGGQGAGKDTAIKNFVIEANLKHNISFIIPDAIVEEGQRGMADGIRDSLPPDKIIDLDLNHKEYIVPMDLTEVITALGPAGSSRFADEIIDFMGDMQTLSRSKRYLRAAAKAAGGSLYNIKRIIEDEEYRVLRIEQLQEEGQERLANELISWGDNEELGSKAEPIINRLDDFFGNDRLFDIFAQDPLPDVDFAKWMKEGKVIILRVPNGRGLGKQAVKTLVHWITLKAFMTRLLMSKDEQKNGCFMVFNEPEQYESEGLTNLMGRIGTEGRKERLGSIYAFHHWNKLTQSLQENLQGGGVQQFLFMNDHTKTFDLSRSRIEDTIPLEDAYKLPAHYAIISVRAGGEMQPAFICHMAPPKDLQYDNSFLTLRHAQLYGRHWKELQQAL